MIALVALLACSDPEPPTGPSPEASARAAAALCKLFEGARADCEHTGGAVEAAGHEVDLVAVVEQEEEALGFRTIVLRVQPTIDGVRRPELDTPAAVNGGGAREELLDKAMHEWAVVYGAALADMLLDDPDRPALRALTPHVDAGRAVGQAEVFRGWTLLVGGSDTGIDHDAVLGHVWPVVAQLPEGVHTVGIRVDHEPGNAQYRCELDGVEHAALCEAARRYAWPVGGPLTRVRQYYVFTPGAPDPSPDASGAPGAPAAE